MLIIQDISQYAEISVAKCFTKYARIRQPPPHLYPGGTSYVIILISQELQISDYRVIIFIFTYYMGTIEPGGNYRRSATQGVQKYTPNRKQIQTHIIAKLW